MTVTLLQQPQAQPNNDLFRDFKVSPMLREFIVIDLFCGAGGASFGLLRALERLGLTAESLRARGWRLRLININHWEIAIDTIKRNIAFAEMYNATIENVDPTFVLNGQRPHLLIAAAECFPAGTLVLTDAGLKDISEIRVGDRVVTHKGRLRRVVATRRSKADTVVLRGHGHYGLEVTKNHPFLISNKTRRWNNERRDYDWFFSKPDWIAASDLEVNRAHWATLTRFPKFRMPVLRSLNLKYERSWWFIGRWLGDGWADGRPGHNSIAIACGNHEVAGLGDELNRLPLKWKTRQTRTATLFECHNRELKNFLTLHFGRLAHGKTLPTFVYSLPTPHRKALLSGYLSADGAITSRREVIAQTTSKALAVGLRMLAESLGLHPTMYRYDGARMNSLIEGRSVKPRAQYRVAWYDNGVKLNNTASFDGYTFHRIRERIDGTQSQTVYNLQVDDDESYIVDGIVVHNCIMYSPARGNRPIRDQSRTTAAWILNWVDCDPYALYFENVPEWSTWGELDEHMRPKPEHKGEYYQQFLRALRDRGYDIAEGVVNCADYGDATTRKRLFICGRKKGIGKERVHLPSPTHTKFPEKFPHLKPWVPARAIIDWNLKGEPITHRDRGPHAPPTLRRIRAGYNKQDAILRPVLLELIDRLLPISEAFHAKLSARPSESKLSRKLTKEEKRDNAQVLKLAKAAAKAAIRGTFREPLACFSSSELTQYEREAFAFVLGQHGGATARPVSEPLPTIAGGGAIGVATVTDGLIIKANASEKSKFNDATQSLDAPLSTIVTKDCRALAQPALSAAKTLVVNGTVSEKSSRFESSSRSADEPLSTIVGVDRHYLAEPILAVVQHGENDERTPDLNAPLPTVTSKGSTGLASPVIAQLYSSNVACNGGGGVDSIDDPLSTITAGGNHHALAEPIIATVHGLKGNENRCRSTDEPIGTIAAGGNQHALAEPVITSRNNARRGERRAHTMDEPLPTATGSGAGYLAEPVVVNMKGQSTARTIDEPTCTITATVKSLGLAEPRVTSNHQGNAGASIHEPLPSATTATGGGIGVAQPDLAIAADELPNDGPYFLLDGVRVAINILYRMLHSSELACAHSFGNVKFSGAEKDAVKQIGNSIPVETASAMIGSVILPVLAEFDDLLERAA